MFRKVRSASPPEWLSGLDLQSLGPRGDLPLGASTLRVLAAALVASVLILGAVPSALAHKGEASWLNNTCRHYGMSFHGYPGPSWWFEGRSEAANPWEVGCTGYKASIVWWNGGAWYSVTDYTTIGPAITVTNEGKPGWAGSGHSR